MIYSEVGVSTYKLVTAVKYVDDLVVGAGSMLGHGSLVRASAFISYLYLWRSLGPFGL